jgi:MFS transporter, DHA3 family, macrolide efflux protein
MFILPFIILALEGVLIVVTGVIAFYISLLLFDQTQNPLIMSLSVFASIAPKIYLSFIAGVVSDFIGKKKIMLLSLAMLFFLYAGVWYLFPYLVKDIYYILAFQVITGIIISAYEISALSSLSSFVDKKDSRAVYSLMSFILNSAYIITPSIAGLLYQQVYLDDIIKHAFFLIIPIFSLLYFIPFPDCLSGQKQLLKESCWQFISKKHILKKLLLFFASYNFINGLASGLVVFYILKRFGSDGSTLAIFSSFIATGTVIGSIISLKKVKNPTMFIFAGTIISAIFGRILFGLELPFGIITAFATLRMCIVSTVNTTNQVVWSTIVPAKSQGQIFGYRRMIAQGGYPIAIILGGMLYQLMDDVVNTNLFTLFFMLCGFLEIILAFFLYKYNTSTSHT